MQRSLLSCAGLAVLLLASSASAAPNIRLTTDASNSIRPRCCLDPSGNTIVVWEDGRFGNDEVLWQKFDQLGNSLSAVVRVTNTAAKSAKPDVACDPAGNSHIVWQEGENVNGVGTVYLARLNPSGTKTLNDRLIKDISGDASVAAPFTETTDIFWHRFSPTDQDVYYRRYNSAGTQTCEKRFNAGTIPGMSKTPAVCSAANGDAQLFWIDMNTSFQLHLRQGATLNSCVSGQGVAWYGDAHHPSTDEGGDGIYTVFEAGGNIYNFLGSPSACQLSQGAGTSTQPSDAADVNQGYAVWRDTRDGNSEIYFCRFYGCPSFTGDVRLTNDAAVSETPDITAEESGSGKWVAVWSDSRDGNPEIYLTSEAALNTPISIHVTGEVRAEHDNDPIVSPAPPLVGVKVTLTVGGNTYSAVTGSDGVAQFPAAYAPGGSYELELDGPEYTIRRQSVGGQLTTETATAPMGAGRTEYRWNYTRAVQAAYQVDRFRRTYWKDRLGYDWRLPSWYDPNRTDNPISVEVYETYNSSVIGAGGGYADLHGVVLCMTNKCEESDVLFHEYTHNVVFDRFAFVGNGPRRIGRNQAGTEEGPAMDEALADYFAASFTNDPQIDRCQFCIVNVNHPCLCLGAKRDLSKRMRYPKNGAYRYEAHQGSLIVSGALWDLRSALDGVNAATAPTTDGLVLRGLDRMIQMRGAEAQFVFADLVTAIKAVDMDDGGAHQAAIDNAFDRHNLGPQQVDYAPLAWSGDVGLTSIGLSTPTQVALHWKPLSGATAYDVLMGPVSHSYSGTGEGGILGVIASGVRDTSYIYTTRDSMTAYLFSVVAIDTAGQPGYMAAPAYVPSASLLSVPPVSLVMTQSAGKWLYSSPNPANSNTRVVFALAREDVVGFEVVDPTGRIVRRIRPQRFDAGMHSMDWDGMTVSGSLASPGVYFVRLFGTSWKDGGKILVMH